MKKFAKWTGIVLGSLLLIGLIAGLILHEPLPEGKESPEAEALARRITQAVNKAAWDTTGAVQWDFNGLHDYLWDRDRQWCRVRWGDTEVLLDLNTVSGQASVRGGALSGEEREEAVQRAWSFFCNDSYWLNAPVKIFDPGTERRIVDLAGGGQGLLVTYTQGGVTPGDSYLWIPDEEGLPERWKLWVSIVPVGGIAFRPTDWVTLPTGARIATRHEGAVLDVEIRALRGAESLEALGVGDPFEGFKSKVKR